MIINITKFHHIKDNNFMFVLLQHNSVCSSDESLSPAHREFWTSILLDVSKVEIKYLISKLLLNLIVSVHVRLLMLKTSLAYCLK